MNIRDEELLNRYFERQMSNAEEQNFLIDVAARDDMRIAFRSQLELLKAVRRDKDVMRGATFVRERTLTALGFAGVALPTLLAEDEAEASTLATATSSGWRAILHKPMVMLTGGLLVGSIATFSVLNTGREDVTQAPATISAPAPKTEILITTPVVDEPVQSIVQPAEAAPVKTKSVTRKAAPEMTNVSNAQPTDLQTNAELPLVTRSEPATVMIKKPKVVKPGETR